MINQIRTKELTTELMISRGLIIHLNVVQMKIKLSYKFHALEVIFFSGLPSPETFKAKYLKANVVLKIKTAEELYNLKGHKEITKSI